MGNVMLKKLTYSFLPRNSWFSAGEVIDLSLLLSLF